MDLEEKIFDHFDTLRVAPVPLPAGLVNTTTVLFSGRLVDYSTLKSMTFLSLYNLEDQKAMLQALDGFLERNYTAVAAWRDRLQERFGGETSNEAYFGIACGDSTSRTSDADVILSTMEKARELSRVAGAAGPSNGPLSLSVCSQWRFDAKERYLGDFHAETKDPILIINNRFDPATPIDSAYNVSTGLVGSRVLEVNGIGVSDDNHPVHRRSANEESL